jgi:prepilin-type N-terminal cleavage/methylation domain-containing protein
MMQETPTTKKKIIPAFFGKLDSRGFTIVEMIVVISIFAILAGMVLFRYNDYIAEINLENTAQDIALEIQQAENNAIDGQYPTLATGQTPVPADWRPSYGVYFEVGGHPKQLEYYFDRESVQPGDPDYLELGAYGRGYLSDPAPFTACGVGSSECESIFTITDDVSIEYLCEGEMNQCGPGLAVGNNLALTFTRPFADLFAIQGAFGTSNDDVGTNNILKSGDIRIRIKSSTTGKERDIVVSQLGQIHVETVTP